MWKSGQSTRYEIVATHTDGRRLLVCYSANKSQRGLVRAIQERGESLVKVCGLPADIRVFWRRAPFPHLAIGLLNEPDTGWRIFASGRTQRDVQVEGGELPFIGALAKAA